MGAFQNVAIEPHHIVMLFNERRSVARIQRIGGVNQ
jgi:hypothetical protein